MSLFQLPKDALARAGNWPLPAHRKSLAPRLSANAQAVDVLFAKAPKSQYEQSRGQCVCPKLWRALCPPVVVCEHGDTSLDFGICPTVSEERKLSPSFALTQNHPLRYLMAIFRGGATWHPMEPVLPWCVLTFMYPYPIAEPAHILCIYGVHVRSCTLCREDLSPVDRSSIDQPCGPPRILSLDADRWSAFAQHTDSITPSSPHNPSRSLV